MDVISALQAHGGVARWSQLVARVPRRALQRAVRERTVERHGGVYALPASDHARVLAGQLAGIVSHRSAAVQWRFAVPPRPDGQPPLEDIAVPPNAARRNQPSDARLRYVQLAEDDVAGGVLTPLATVAFCLRDLPLRDALSIGDSALRSGLVTREALRERVSRFRNRGSARAQRRVALLDGRSANAFESCCRAILIEGRISGFVPQVSISHHGSWIGRVDLANRALRIVIECDGFETHGTLKAMTADCLRHTRLVAAGWRPLRFTWHQVMFQPEWVLLQVRDTIRQACAEACGDAGLAAATCRGHACATGPGPVSPRSAYGVAR